jgi:hypothetical protein
MTAAEKAGMSVNSPVTQLAKENLACYTNKDLTPDCVLMLYFIAFVVINPITYAT